PAGQQVAPEILATHNAWIKGSKEIAGLMLMTMEPEIQRNLEPLHAHEILKELKTLFAQQAEQELLQTMRDFHSSRQEKGQSVSSYVLKMNGYIDNLERLGHPVTLGLGVSLILIGLRKEYDGFMQNYNMHSMGKTVNELHAMLKLHEQTLPKSNAPALNTIRAGKNKQAYAPKPKIPPPPKRENPAKDSICHECKETRHWKRNCPQYLAELIKKKKNTTSGAGGSGIFVIELNTILNRSWVYDTGCGTHICNTTQGLMASRKLKPGALSLYVGNGQCEAVEAIGSSYLCLPSGLEIVLNNCHYAPSITRGVIFVSRLYEDGFVNRFVDNTIQLSRNNVVYFSAIPRDENQLGKTIKSLHFDRGGEYMSQEFLDPLKDHGIIVHRTPPYTPQHNGVSKRRNRTLLDMVRSMMNQTTLPKSFWDYALETAARILNMVPTKKVEKTPYEVWHGQAPKLSYLKVWGCEALVKRDTLTKPTKLEPRSIKCIFIGYPKETMGYSFYYPPENKVLVARNAEFLKNSLINQEASGSLEDLEIIQEEDTYPSIDTSLNHEEDDLEIDEPQRDLGEPANYKAALLDPESEKWLNAMNVKIQSMKYNEVWVLVKLPPNGKTVGSNWLFKKKTDMDGNVHIYKARLVAKGYTHTSGIDYEETFSSVADIRAIMILIAIAAYYDYEIWKIYVKTAFLNGYLNEEVYMEQPEGFVNPKYPNRVCKLKRSIYGLKQASRQWNKRFDDEIKKFGFTQNRDEPCVYIKASGSNITFLILYVDDILIMGNSIPMLQSVKTYRGKYFAMKDLSEAAYILGIKIYRDRSKRLIGLCQSAYIEKILKLYCMENSKRGSIPMQEKIKLSKSQGASTPAELKRMQNVPYASAVGSIMYAVRCTRLDVAFAQNEAVWVTKFISRLNVVPIIEEPISMYCDNIGAIAIANESRITKGARHFCAKVHYLREVIEFSDIKVEKVHTDDNLADPFTKALAFPKHFEHTRNIGMLPTSSLM
nr:retrotransposon protein, putative, Ty1-copia subclass [Tanacetum cinerariifolium]